MKHRAFIGCFALVLAVFFAFPAFAQLPDGAVLWLEARSLVVDGSPDLDYVSTCHSSTCRENEVEDAPADESFCDTPPATVAGSTGDCAAGCPRFWLDLGPNAGRQTEAGVSFDVGMDDAEKPCLVLDCLNGHACIRGRLSLSETPGDLWYAGAQLELQIPDIITLGDFYLVAILRADPDQGAEDQCVLGDATHHLCVKPSGALRLRLGGFDANISTAGAVTSARFHLVEVVRSGSTLTVFVDGVNRTTGSPSSGTSLVVSNFMSYFKGSGAFAGDLALVALYGTAPSAAARRQVGLYAADVFGVGAYVNRHRPPF